MRVATNRGRSRMRRHPVAAFAWVIVLLLTTDRIAFGQAGSTGGTLGKTDKSASGGEEQSHRSSPPSSQGAKASPCAKATGDWAWFNGGTVIIRSNGTTQHDSSSDSGKWSCINGQVVITWASGFNDRLSLSSDGKRLQGSNGLIPVSGDRK